MKKFATVAVMVGALRVTSIAAPSPAEPRVRGFGPALAGGLIAGAVIGGLASSAYA
jgi:predicted lipid-binding transport protein (Tim44 family)